jgi:sugar phosphate isomerase/epimerase
LPENPSSEEYRAMIPCLRDICEHMKNNGQFFLFETGQETPVTLRRTIEDIGTGNAGVNLDVANLILYGKANPIDALGIIGEYVKNIHAKDGHYPTSGKELGKEVSLGKGAVNFPLLAQKLKAMNYSGDITIEREVSGDEQKRDILEAKKYLESLFD